MRATPTTPSANRRTSPFLESGDRMTQPEFHRRYQQSPPGVKAELVGGVVYMPSPVGIQHGIHDPELTGALWLYKGATPGVQLLHNATTILGASSEPQPDLALRIAPEFGGRSQTNANYVQGAPELIAEIAHSSRSFDLNQKLIDYRDAGVLEYIVWSIEEPELHWFDFTKDKPLRPNRQGIYCSRVFPGLWIDRDALLARDTRRIAAAVQQGTATRTHAAFVKRLATAHRKLSSD